MTDHRFEATAMTTAPRMKAHTHAKTGGFRLLGRFRRDRTGAAAIEFAIVAVPFLVLLFAIIETSVIHFASGILDTATSTAARDIRTGRAKQDNWTTSSFKQEVCNGLSGMFDCEGRLYVDVKSYSGFAAADLSSPLNDDRELDDDDFGYTSGDRGEIIVVRTFYRWPVIFDFFSLSLADMANGDRLLGSVVTFRNEPFPW
ncbi:TadE/TadG family type IV pilus assembly protein [Methylobrevis pamukkalensis]|uniref:TadE-like protein n=1 Tax=Methylobrevis pamukkalensis TaxID=1439726 RepID=A0A1E3H5W5_9HYPH|nr:TadE/TadG family type IV pilus assembly protein [Methylobrevis pamukkalensis]ODN70911.1 TadE-like protein [Methylobrevis pamukkalensis]